MRCSNGKGTAHTEALTSPTTSPSWAGTSSSAAPNAKYPAVYLVTLNPWTRVTHVSPLYYDEAPAYQANGSKAGKTINLALTDPDSNEVVPWAAPKYAGRLQQRPGYLPGPWLPR